MQHNDPEVVMPNITVELLSGRTLDQRREFVAALTDAAVDILKARREAVRIVFTEIEKSDVANGGVLESDK
ncbi:4-oxalocrotonate tautomerase [Streptosporangium becharense]|uniref:4-oxalocrotonate tautomerase n=2 Tax=Streptosporangium TaxID=2000 RepID=A0A7W9IDQ0_9ACTN|nr:tautomerase family protein [Streptosporangium becharense]MBB5818792.1 4-oxalocrotonate tautomerase [Streptosporangium becharense]